MANEGQQTAESKNEEPTEYVSIHLQFSEKALGRLEEIKARAGITSNAEFFKNAARIYEWFLQRRDEGCEIIVRSKDATEAKVVELHLDEEQPAQPASDS